MFYVEAMGSSFMYNIPSFDVISVSLCHLKVKGRDNDGKETPYYLFVRDDASEFPELPALIAVKDSTFVKVSYLTKAVSTLMMCLSIFKQKEEFGLIVNADSLALFPFGALIVWSWEWNATADETSNSSQSECENRIAEGHFNPHMETESSDGDDQNQSIKTHVVTFKCIGAVHDQSRQKALEKAATLLRQGEQVDVRLIPEPDNAYDSKAIVFQCNIEGKWCVIGYMVREVLDAVHEAIRENKIIYTKFSWVKYRVMWLRSGPGFYAGIDVALNGQWPLVVVQHASTV